MLRNGVQGEFGIHDGVFALVALFDWLGGDFMENLAFCCVTTATGLLLQQAAAAFAAFEGVSALVALLVSLGGDKSVPLSGLVVLQPSTGEVQQPAAAVEGCHLALRAKAALRVDVGDTASDRLGICDVPAGEFGPGTLHSLGALDKKRRNPVTGDPVLAFSCSPPGDDFSIFVVLLTGQLDYW